MPTVRIEFNIPGFNEFRRQAALQDDLHARGERIAQAAGGDGDFLVVDEPHGTRARVVVLTGTEEGKAMEAKSRALTRAIDAGRG